MMTLEKNMKWDQMERKAKELKKIETKNKEEATRLDDLARAREEQNKKLEQQREEMQKLQQEAESETDSNKKRRLTVQIRQFVSRFQSAERKVKRMEIEYKRSLQEHENKLKAEELRRKENLRRRREQLKSRRAHKAAQGRRKRPPTILSSPTEEPDHVGEAEVWSVGTPAKKSAPAPPAGATPPPQR